MAWSEVVARRRINSRTYRDDTTGQFRMEQVLGTHLHYPTGGPDSGVMDGVVDMTPVRIDNTQFDGWRITAGDWHYALGKDLENHGNQDGWLGFGGRQGQHWLKFRLTRIGYLHWPTRAWDDIGGAPTYNRANLSGQIETMEIGPSGDAVNVLSSATWANLWTTPGGGSLSATWRAEGRQLKEDIRINAAARAWITANRPPSTSANETWLGFMFQVDWSDIPRAVRADILQNTGAGGDFSDDGLPIELQDAQERVLAFLPVDVAWAASDVTRTIALRKRFWRDPDDGNDYLIVGARVSDLATLPAGDVVFDPTTTIQPDATAGFDLIIIDITPNTNYATNVLAVGDASGAAVSAYRTLIKFDLSSIPSIATVTDASVWLNEYLAADGPGVGPWNVVFRRLLRNWVETTATWNVYDTASNWNTAGAAGSGSDISASDSASVTMDGAAAAGFVEWSGATLTDDVQKMVDGTYSNYGWRLAALSAERQGTAAQTSANYFRSSDYATASDRPKIEVTYSLNLTLTGSIAASGAAVKGVGKSLASSITSTGVLVKRAAKALAGSILSAGTVLSRGTFLKTLTGSLTATGSLAKRISKRLAGTVGLAGGLVRNIAKDLAGSITGSGTVQGLKAYLLSLSGSLTPAGTVSRLVGKKVSGSLTATGVLARNVAKTLAGSVTATGSLTRSVGKLLAGSITGSTSLVRKIAKNVVGTVAPAGGVLKSVSKSLAGAISLVGELTFPGGEMVETAIALAAKVGAFGVRLVRSGVVGTLAAVRSNSPVAGHGGQALSGSPVAGHGAQGQSSAPIVGHKGDLNG